MRRPDVDRMMASMTAREYKEWEAYERAFGPLDREYDREMLAQLHELIQINNILTGASLTKKGKKNPAGKFRKAQRAHDVYMPPDEEEEEIAEDDDEYDDEIDDDEGEEEAHESDSGEYDPSKDPFTKW